MITLFDLLVVAAILGAAYWGWLVGVEVASVAALELLACLGVAVMLHEAVAGFLRAGFTFVLGDWVGSAWSVLLAFAGLAWGSFALIRLLIHERKTSADDRAAHEHAEIDPLADRAAGAVAGGIGGAVLAGGALVTLSMVPFLAGLKPSGDRMLLDVGKLVLRAAGQFAGERHEGRSLPLWGEPPSRMSEPTARLASEPWFDADEDGSCGDADRFRDVDGSGIFTKDLYFTDVDGDGVRRVGLVDKYVAGRWDALVRSDDRKRPELEKPPKPAAKPAPKPSPKKPAVVPPPKPPDPRPAEPKTPDVKPDAATPADPKPAVAPPAEPTPATAEPPAAKTPDEAPAEPKRPDDDF